MRGGKDMIRKIAVFLAIAMTITAMTACSSNNQGRTIIKDGDKDITIIEPKTTTGAEELRVEKIEEYKDIRALDWQDEDRLLVSKKNTNANKISVEGEEFYPNNLYILDTKNGEYKILNEESANQLFAEFSPDKKHIFYKTNNEETARGYIMDLQGKNVVSITGDRTIHFSAGKWIDNERVIYADFNNTVYEGDVSGKIVEVANLGPESTNKSIAIGETFYYTVSSVFRNGDELYFLTSNLDLKKYDLVSKETSLLDKNVLRVYPSKDFNKIAYVKMAEDQEVKLIVTDTNWNKKTLAEGMAISEATWSPDNTRLVYSVVKESSEENGIYLSDLKTEKTSRISLFDGIIGFGWSPSGKKISVCRFDKDYNFLSNIIILNN